MTWRPAGHVSSEGALRAIELQVIGLPAWPRGGVIGALLLIGRRGGPSAPVGGQDCGRLSRPPFDVCRFLKCDRIELPWPKALLSCSCAQRIIPCLETPLINDVV